METKIAKIGFTVGFHDLRDRIWMVVKLEGSLQLAAKS